jgi:outer membrane protein assembly factor BamB
MHRSSHPGTGVARALVAVFGVALAGIGVVLVSPAGASAVTTTVWRTDGYGPGNTGYNPIETAVNTGTVASLSQAWSVVSPVVRNSCSQQSPPVVANNRLYLADQGGIAAYDATTGARAWSYRFAAPDDEVTPRLTVLGSRLFAAMNGCRSVSDPDGELVAFDALTGDVLWRVSRDAPAGVMVVDKDVVVVSGQDVGEPVVTAYRIADGVPLWSRVATLSRPVSANGRLLLTRFEAAGSDLVDIRTGAVLWSSPTTWSVLASGPAGGPLFAAGPGGELVRLDVETGAVAWSEPAAAGQLGTDGARLYVTQGSQLVTRDAATGSQLWRRAFSAPLGKPVVAGGVVYATVSGHGVHPLSAVTGEALDGDPPYDGAVGHPVVVNGRLYVTTGRLLDAYTL